MERKTLGAMASTLHITVSLFILGFSVGQRNVTVPKGPLLRAKGYNISIWCRVSGYEGPSEQNFQWSVYLTSAPEREMHMVSTLDPRFPYAVYEQRVRRGDISVERVTGDHVLLHITDLQDRDAGMYECHTPTTDLKYHGTYNAMVNLQVIPDTLEVIMAPQTLRKVEGDSLELTCTVSKATFSHTHLSVTWYHHSGDDSNELLSLTKDFVLSPGTSYQQRFASRDVRLDKTGDTLYKLTISKLQPSDQGEIHCEAIEWIQDLDGSWKDIAKKKSEKTTVTVESLGRDFRTSIRSTESPLLMGNSLEVTCSVRAQNLPGRLFQISWFHDGTEIALMDPYGVPSIRRSLSRLLAVRRNMEDYTLVVSHAAGEDGGRYSCEVSEMERPASGSLVAIQNKRSEEVSIHVAPADSSLEVSLVSRSSQIPEGQSIELQCSAGGTAHALSVSWHLAREGGLLEQIAVIERDGSLKVLPPYLERHSHRTLRAEKTGPTSFKLELDYVMTTDGGLYKCQVTEWSQAADGMWKMLNERHQEAFINVKSLSTGLAVTLQSRTPIVQLGDTFKLTCRISMPLDSLVTITWQYLPLGATEDTFHPLVKIHHSGGVEWTNPYFQEKATVTGSAESSQLTLRKASWKEDTSYRCKVEVLRRSWERSWITAATAMSNRLRQKVTEKKSELALNPQNKHLLVSSGIATLEIDCQLTKVPGNSWFNVMWYFLSSTVNAQPIRLLTAGFDGVVDYSPELATMSAKYKFYSERVSRNMYKLNILQVNHSDRGTYYCAVEEWTWSADDGWLSSGRTESGKTTVEFKPSENYFKLKKENRTITATESEEVTMSCSLEGPAHHGSTLSLTWFYRGGSSLARVLFKMGPHMAVEYPDKEKAKRLLFNTNSPGNYSLTLRPAAEEDTGFYYCQVEEWRIGAAGSWQKEAGDISGWTHLTIHWPADSLQVNNSEINLVLPEGQDSLTMPCEVTSRSNPASIFSVTWWKASGLEKQLMFRDWQDTVSIFGNISDSSSDNKWDRRLWLEKSSELWYHLTILRPEVSDSGIYFCVVEEWMPSPTQIPYRISEKRSGNITVAIQQADVDSHVTCPTSRTGAVTAPVREVQVADRTFASRVCSSHPLVIFMLVLLVVLGILLIAVITVLWLTSRGSDSKRYNPRKGKSLWTVPDESFRRTSTKTKSEEEDGNEY